MFSETVAPDKVAAYVRWSTDEQGEGTTLEVQREACEHYIKSQGWQFREDLLFIDDGHSGGTLDRPGLKALRKAVASGRVCCCVVYKLDRLSRSVLDTVNLILQEWDGLCYMKSTREPVDTTTPTGKIFFYMLASYAEWERSVIRERTMSGKAKRAQQGRNPGMVYCYGYAPGAVKGQWVIQPEEAAVVRRMFLDYIQGHSDSTIAEALNAEGVRGRGGAKWQTPRIRYTLNNPIYMGVLRYGSRGRLSHAVSVREGRLRRRYEAPRYAEVSGAVPAIVTAAEYEQAQAVRASKRKVAGKKALTVSYLLTGTIACRCGALLNGCTLGNRGHRYYRCPHNTKGQANRCACALMPADALEDAVVGQVRKAFAADQRGHFVQQALQALTQRRQAAEAALAALERTLGSIQHRHQRLDTDYDAGELPARIYAARIEGLEAEERELMTARQAHLDTLADLRSVSADLPRFDAISSRLDGWEMLDPEQRKQLLRFAVGRCRAYRASGAKRWARNPEPVEIDLQIWRPDFSDLISVDPDNTSASAMVERLVVPGRD